ncbi:hypothetical protein EOPP23_07415 [Endozoicomonas sp. OPT23]|uniref:hypothetical protein n=1 Tax=Endozoicomonas sp. OPT23 TaxID=2072845 RepID=UPI0018917FAE|nr:hypothetical protein [Endozoicomonas sp. OPT23]MRI32811.1 hypothetical protein [Endozoicomonas sp. OPT23]
MHDESFIEFFPSHTESYFENTEDIQWGLKKITNCGKSEIKNSDEKKCAQESLAAIAYPLSFVHKGLIYQTGDVAFGPAYRFITNGWKEAAGSTLSVASLIASYASYMGVNKFRELTKGDANSYRVGYVTSTLSLLPKKVKQQGEHWLGVLAFKKISLILSATFKAAAAGGITATQYIGNLSGQAAAIVGGVSAFSVLGRYIMYRHLMQQFESEEEGFIQQWFYKGEYSSAQIRQYFDSWLSMELFNQILLAKLQSENIKLDMTVKPSRSISTFYAYESDHYARVRLPIECTNDNESCHAGLNALTDDLSNSGEYMIIAFTNEDQDKRISGDNSYIINLYPDAETVLISLPGQASFGVAMEDLQQTLSVLYRVLASDRVASFY